MSEVKQYDNNNTGIIGKNDYATTDKHPNKEGKFIPAWEIIE